QEYLQALAVDDFPDVVYLDPMFPMSKKTALVKKEMRLFHSLVGEDDGGEALLAVALQRATHRVVVKRPPKADYLAGRKPQLSVSGKAVRFDIYTLKAFGK
ncbi:MAG: class I SAM-dependent methyltransferase, partial [Spongiibacteraceae bacterium]